MTDFHSLASTRRSIRKFTDADVPLNDVLDCVSTAVTAPSGCNSQCWKFVIVRNKSVLKGMADILSSKSAAQHETLGLAGDSVYAESKQKMITFFAKAPLCIAVFMTDMEYYDTRLTDAWFKMGHTRKELMDLYGQPDLLSIGAAIENLLLALHEKGLGACWMNDPVLARDELNDLLGVDRGEPLISLIPVGYPAYQPKEKKYKPMDDILKIID